MFACQFFKLPPVYSIIALIITICLSTPISEQVAHTNLHTLIKFLISRYIGGYYSLSCLISVFLFGFLFVYSFNLSITCLSLPMYEQIFYVCKCINYSYIAVLTYASLGNISVIISMLSYDVNRFVLLTYFSFLKFMYNCVPIFSYDTT